MRSQSRDTRLPAVSAARWCTWWRVEALRETREYYEWFERAVAFAKGAAYYPSIDRKIERRCYELLRKAYVEARYSRHYRITAEQLEWFSVRVKVLQGLVRELCEERISTLAKAA